jgi:hypothetical protein
MNIDKIDLFLLNLLIPVPRRHSRQQCEQLLQLAISEVPMSPNAKTTTQIVQRLAVYHKTELERIGFPTSEYYLYDYVLRQLKKARKLGWIDGELKNAGAVRSGQNYSYISWSFSINQNSSEATK